MDGTVARQLLDNVNDIDAKIRDLKKINITIGDMRLKVKNNRKLFFDNLKKQLDKFHDESENVMETFVEKQLQILTSQIISLKSFYDEGKSHMKKLGTMHDDDTKYIATINKYLLDLFDFKKSLNNIPVDFEFMPILQTLETSKVSFNKFYAADPRGVVIMSNRQDPDDLSKMTAFVDKTEVVFLHTNVSHQQDLVNHFSVTIQDPEQKILPGVTMSDENDGSYFIFYKPKMVGIHLMHIKLYNVPVKLSPIIITALFKKNYSKCRPDSKEISVESKMSGDADFINSTNRTDETGDGNVAMTSTPLKESSGAINSNKNATNIFLHSCTAPENNHCNVNRRISFDSNANETSDICEVIDATENDSKAKINFKFNFPKIKAENLNDVKNNNVDEVVDDVFKHSVIDPNKIKTNIQISPMENEEMIKLEFNCKNLCVRPKNYKENIKSPKSNDTLINSEKHKLNEAAVEEVVKHLSNSYSISGNANNNNNNNNADENNYENANNNNTNNNNNNKLNGKMEFKDERINNLKTSNNNNSSRSKVNQSSTATKSNKCLVRHRLTVGRNNINFPIGVYQADNLIYACDTANDLVKGFNDSDGMAFDLYEKATLPMKRPSALLMNDRSRDELYIKDNKAIHVLNLRTKSLSRVIGRHILDRPFGLAWSDKNALILIDQPNDSAKLKLFDPRTSSKVGEYIFEPYFRYVNLTPMQRDNNISKQRISKCRFLETDDCYVYVVDLGRSTIYVSDMRGKKSFQYGCFGKLLGSFNEPSGITKNHNGTMFIADSRNNRVQVYNMFGIPHNILQLDEAILRPSDIYFSPQNQCLYISNLIDHCIKVYQM